jgi:hypothetical protein
MSAASHRRTYQPAFTSTETGRTNYIVRVSCSCGDSTVGVGATPEAAQQNARELITRACTGQPLTVEGILAHAIRPPAPGPAKLVLEMCRHHP